MTPDSLWGISLINFLQLRSDSYKPISRREDDNVQAKRLRNSTKMLSAKNSRPKEKAMKICLVVLTIFASASILYGQQLYRVTIQRDVNVKMRDGVSLTADVYRPISDQTFPVLLERTPYNRAGEASMANELASHGYIVVLQDTRGRYDSGGEFYPFRNESSDGYDTVEWAAELDHSNGRVGMFGGSYVGATQMLAAMSRPPHLTAIFPYVTASEYYDGWTYQSGALMQWFSSSWTSILALDTLRRQAESTQAPKQWIDLLPLTKYPILQNLQISSLAPYFQDWLKHEANDAFWQQWRVSDHYRDMTVVGLHGAGWNDLFLKGSIRNFILRSNVSRILAWACARGA